MSYTPRPDHLDPEPMAEEWREVADAVLPFNRERMRERADAAVSDLTNTMIRFTVVLRDAATPALERLAAALRAFRPPRARRSGHRHRGTRDHSLRYAGGRKDVPLGRRTVSKLGSSGAPDEARSS